MLTSRLYWQDLDHDDDDDVVLVVPPLRRQLQYHSYRRRVPVVAGWTVVVSLAMISGGVLDGDHVLGCCCLSW